jgi:hypothetical protein
VDPLSDALIAAMSPDAALHLDLGTTEEYYGIPYTVVPASQPLVPITYGTGGYDYSDESDAGPMPIPPDAAIEGGSSADPNPASGDRHVLVLQQRSCTLYELYNTERLAGGFRVSSSAIWNLTVNHSRPAGWTSADAAGLPILPGLLRYDEAAAGAITHALRFTTPAVRRAYIAPASHCGSYSDASRPPYGLRVRLKAGGRSLAVRGAGEDGTHCPATVWAHPGGPGVSVVRDRTQQPGLGGRAEPAPRPPGPGPRFRGDPPRINDDLLRLLQSAGI